MSERVKMFMNQLFCRHKEQETYIQISYIAMVQVSYTTCKKCGKILNSFVCKI